MGSGAIGGEAAQKAVQYVAKKHGLPGFEEEQTSVSRQDSSLEGSFQQSLTDVQEQHYPYIFHRAPVGMAIASLGGTLLDCNDFFCLLTNAQFTKEEIRRQRGSIFNLLPKEDLQDAFERISQLLTDSTSASATNPLDPIILRSSIDEQLGLRVSLVQRDIYSEDSSKYLVVTLLQRSANLTSLERPKHLIPALLPSIGKKFRRSVSDENQTILKEQEKQEQEGSSKPVFMVG